MIMNKLRVISLLLGFILLFSFSLDTSFGADPDFPRWQIGNWWKFNVEISGKINRVGTVNYTIVSDDFNIVQYGQDFNCYQIDVLGGGTIFGEIGSNKIGGNWTITELHNYMKSDLSWVSTSFTYEETISVNDDSGVYQISSVQYESISSTSTVNTTYNPPFEANEGFPLTVGKRWSAATTETTTEQITVSGNTESTTESEAYTKSFLVLRKETIALSIGETETYVIKRTNADGDYSETYYSPEVGFDVKDFNYDSTGTLYGTMELLSYDYQRTRDFSQLSTSGIFPFLIIVSIIVISAIATIYLLKKKNRYPISNN